MTIDLWMLVWVVVLAFAQMIVAALGAASRVGLPTLAGNREGVGALTGWPGRAERAYRNMLEALPLFAVLVLVGHAAGLADATTALGAQLFFYGRIAHAVVYLVGIAWLRTAVWAVSVIGLVIIAVRLLSATAAG